MTDTTHVTIGIVSWNVADHLARCLESLPAALDGLPAEVVVVDNASSDDSVQVAEAAGVKVVRSPRNVGYPHAMNTALRDSRAPVLIALNPDTVPPPRSLRQLVEELERRPRAAVVGPLLRRPDGTIEHSVHRFPSLTLLALANLVPPRLLPRGVRDRFWLAGAVRPGRTCEVDWVVGAVHVLRRAALPDGGPYRERWFMYAEDVDLCWRLAQEGLQTWFVGDVEVEHIGGASARQRAEAGSGPPWTSATYDWYELAFGTFRTRVFAALNLLGELRVALGRLVASASRPGRDPAARRQLRAGLQLAGRHLRVVLRGADG